MWLDHEHISSSAGGAQPKPRRAEPICGQEKLREQRLFFLVNMISGLSYVSATEFLFSNADIAFRRGLVVQCCRLIFAFPLGVNTIVPLYLPKSLSPYVRSVTRLPVIGSFLFSCHVVSESVFFSYQSLDKRPIRVPLEA